MFITFTNKPIAYGTTIQVLSVIEMDSRGQVDQLVKHALENGAMRYRAVADHGLMYCDCFADIVGHRWEVMFINATPMQK
jgi:predicted lactoylglutathione lyase